MGLSDRTTTFRSSSTFLNAKTIGKMATVPAPVPPAQPATNQSQMNPLPPSVFTLAQTAQLEALYTIIRPKETSRGDFLFYSDRIIWLLLEERLNHLPVVKKVADGRDI